MRSWTRVPRPTVALINGAIGDGLTPQNENWPVRLERWKGTETVTGVARGQDLTIVGAAVMPILFRGQDGREKTQKMRFKIFGKGCSGWMGVIIGGPSLEPIPLGLGLKTTPGGHHFESLGLSVRRHEEPDVSDRLDFFYAMREQGGREELEVSKEHLSANLWAEETDSKGEDEEDFAAG